MLPELDNWDWEEVFKYADVPDFVPPTPGRAGYDPVTRDDVAGIVSMEEGENDGDSWVGVFALNNGYFLAIRAWCDYTGWG